MVYMSNKTIKKSSHVTLLKGKDLLFGRGSQLVIWQNCKTTNYNFCAHLKQKVH